MVAAAAAPFLSERLFVNSSETVPQVAAVEDSPASPEPTATELALRHAVAQRNEAAAAGDVAALEAALGAIEDAISSLRGLERAAAENELGLTQRLLGQTRRDPALLASAVGHYREALRTFEAAGADEAATVRWNLAIALRLFGEAGGDAASLEEAVAVLRELIAVRSPSLDQVAADKNLGLALLALGELQNDTQALSDAVAALRSALEGADRDGRRRLDWAETQNALANALQSLGEREWSLERLEEALVARRNAWVLYESAGYDTYRFYFETRIAALEQLIEQRRDNPLTPAAPSRVKPTPEPSQ